MFKNIFRSIVIARMKADYAAQDAEGKVLKASYVPLSIKL